MFYVQLVLLKNVNILICILEKKTEYISKYTIFRKLTKKNMEWKLNKNSFPKTVFSWLFYIEDFYIFRVGNI